MAWHTIQATDDLLIELWPAGDAAAESLLKIRSTATEGNRRSNGIPGRAL
jgi:hypothetical protein